MKKVLIVVVIIIALVVIGIALLFSNLDSLVAKAIEKNGSAAVQTHVGVSGVEIALREGRGTISGLSVESPEGYRAREAFSLEEITLDIDIESLRGEPIVIEEVRVIAPVINAEITETGSSNIDELRKNVQAYSSGSTKDADEGSSREAKRIRIERFVFEEGSIAVDASDIGLEGRTITLPEFRLEDIGGEAGALPDEIAQIIMTEVAKRVAAQVAESELKGTIKDKAKGLLDKITE